MRIDHELTIEAPADTVWALTRDVERWPALTPTITAVERLDDGPIGVGSRARLHQPGQRPTVWTVTAFEPARRFAWQATVLGVRMEAGHEIVPTDGGCRNRLSLDLHGRSGGLLGRLAGRRLARTIAVENEGFKRHAEARHA
jgi:uncharacterized membrane protein